MSGGSPLTKHTVSTGSVTPFHLSMDENHPGLSSPQAAANGYKPAGAEDDTDTFSVTSRYSFASTTEGVDVLTGGGDDLTSVTGFFRWTKFRAGRVVSSVLFKRCVLSLILVCTILLALRTLDFGQESRIIHALLSILLWIFTLEVLMQACFYQNQVLFTGWLLADIIIVSVAWGTGDKSCLVLRAFRLIRALRKASGFPSLKWAVKAVLRVLPRIMAVLMVLLPGMFAIFAILFTNLFSDAQDVSQNYFGRLDLAALTLFEIMTGGRNWAVISEEMQEQYPLSWLPLVLFVAVSLFFFGSLIVAVMCDAVSSINREQLQKSLDHRVAPSGSKEDHHLTYAEHQAQDSIELRRLEKKLDSLVSTVDKLVRMQASMQESITLLSQQEMAMQQASNKDL